LQLLFSLDAQPFDHITSALYLARAAMNFKSFPNFFSHIFYGGEWWDWYSGIRIGGDGLSGLR
jgi:hypothetical protein